MNDTFIKELKSFGCTVERDFTLKIERHANEDMDETAVDDWWQARKKEKPWGWVQFSNANVWLANDGWEAESDCPLLAAELVIGDASHHLRFNGSGWVAIKMTRAAEPGAVLETRTMVHAIKDSPPLTYEVAWGGAPLRPAAFRLVQTGTADAKR